MSLPVGVRSTRVRNLSSSPVENALSKTLPIVLRMMSFGSFARFSTQSVSSTPASARSWTSAKPLSFQKVRTSGNNCSGGSVLLIQRSEPRRSILKVPTAVGATDGVPVVGAATATCVGAAGVAGARGAGVAAATGVAGGAAAAAGAGAPGVAGAVWKVDALTTPLVGW